MNNNGWLLRMVVADTIAIVLLVVVLIKLPVLMTALIPLAFIVLVATNFVFVRRHGNALSQAPNLGGAQFQKKNNAISLYAVCFVFLIGIIMGIFMMLRRDISLVLIPLFIIPISAIVYCLKLAAGRKRV